MDWGIVFDLDDTLYLERDFADSGYRAVANTFRDHVGGTDLYAAIQRRFAAGQRRNIFDDVVQEASRKRRPDLVGAMVECYRNHKPDISLAPDAHAWLSRRNPGLPLGLISDGLAVTQRLKFESLGLAQWIEHPIFTQDLGEGMGKPHPRAFELMPALLDAATRQWVYVADNPAKDFRAPRQMGWLTIRIRRIGGLYRDLEPSGPEDSPHAEMENFTELDAILIRG